MLHLGTLVALLVYFWRDWVRLVPAGVGLIVDRSTRGDPQRRLALAIALATIPAAIAGALLNDVIETNVRQPGLVALMLVVGGVVLWLAERWGSQQRRIEDLAPASAFGIGVAQAIALAPGISRSGISIAGGLFVGLERAAAARFSFLMSAPVIAGAILFEGRKLATGESGVSVEAGPLLVGLVASFGAGIIAIGALLRYLRTNPTHIFVAYRFVLAALVVVVLLSR
jgi:undecaprenyl-diphosphatase